jgi:hypothetical protein
MKLLALYDLQQEINRLFIAGSKFAKDDPRLQKQAIVFNKLGEKSPVFKKIAEGIENLVRAKSSDSSSKLLEISTLLYAVLYTQGETVDAEQQVSELTPVLSLEDVSTNKSYLAIKPLIEILSIQKGERMKYATTAFKNGLFNDFRIYHLLDAALSDRYVEFADYIETTVIPSIGKPIIPFILNGFNYEGKADDVRRFRILCKLNYPGISEMVNKILVEASVPLQAEAVKTLSSDPQNEELLIKFAGDKQKPVRLSAYEALANLNTESAQCTLVESFVVGKRKSDISELGEILKIKLSDKFIPRLLEKAKDSYEKCLELDKSANVKNITDAFESFRTCINPIIYNVNEDVQAFYKDVFTNKKYRELSKKLESRDDYHSLPEQIALSVAKGLEYAKEGLDCLKFLSENSHYYEFSYFDSETPVKNETDYLTSKANK